MLRDDADVNGGAEPGVTFPSRALSRWVVVLGALANGGTLALFAWLAWSEPDVLAWVTPFVGGFVAGCVAYRLRPEDVAARRVLLFGAAAGTFIGAIVGSAVAYDELGQRWWLGPANLAAQVVGLALEASMIAMLAVYPDGRYHRPYERRVVRTAAVLVLALPCALLVAGQTLHPMWAFAWGTEGETASFPEIDSPLHVPALSFLAAPLGGVLDSALALGPLVGAILVAARYRRLAAPQRRQIRWPVYGVLLVGLVPATAALASLDLVPPGAVDAVVITTFVVLPISVVVGLVRPELFDVDLAARRSVVFAALWLVIAGAYAAVAASLGLAVSTLGLPAVVAVTILAAALFEPVRRRFTRKAERWVYGDQLGGEALMTWLEQALEEQVDVGEMADAIAAATTEAMGVHWTRVSVDGQAPAIGGDPDAAGQPSMSAELVHAGRRFGEITCGPRIRAGRRDGSDEVALQALARQVAAAIHNVGLAADLRVSLAEQRRQSAELAASRGRLVEAEESARRRIERDLHDGAQQELVGLSAQIGLARAQHAGVDGVETTLGDLQEGVREALEQLRRLAHGIHPTELADHGLVEAIEGRSARLPVRVVMTCEPMLRTARFGDRVETAAYFFVSEALTNVVKHAGVVEARVTLTRTDDELVVAVTDDGGGFAPEGAVDSPGLRGLRDRIEAVGGTVELTSTPGSGTAIRARLPVQTQLGSTP